MVGRLEEGGMFYDGEMEGRVDTEVVGVAVGGEESGEVCVVGESKGGIERRVLVCVL